jgi:hypothetical protein
MRILLDECVPRRLGREFPGHDVHTVPGMGWSGQKNGQLLRSMAGESFDILITVDQNIRHQQNLKAAGVAVVVLVAATNRLADLLPLIPATLAALGSAGPGDVVEIRI